jgi:hypothetical protein
MLAVCFSDTSKLLPTRLGKNVLQWRTDCDSAKRSPCPLHEGRFPHNSAPSRRGFFLENWSRLCSARRFACPCTGAPAFGPRRHPATRREGAGGDCECCAWHGNRCRTAKPKRRGPRKLCIQQPTNRTVPKRRKLTDAAASSAHCAVTLSDQPRRAGNTVERLGAGGGVGRECGASVERGVS